MDGSESDVSDEYYSATEQTQPEKSTDGWPATTRGTRDIKSPSIGEDAKSPKDGKSNPARKIRRQQRHHSECTAGSPLINHALNGMNTLYVLWANQKLCDVIVVAGVDEFAAHGVALATHSDYFLRSLLSKQSGGAACITPQRIELGSLVSASGFRRILRYMYTAELELTWATVCDILQVASALTVTRVVELGQEFLQTYTIENCLGAMLVARKANLTSLHASIRRFVQENLPAVSRTKEFLQCPVEVIADLLAGDNVGVSRDADVLVAAKNWIRANGEAGLENELAKHKETDGALMRAPEVGSKVTAVHAQHSPTASTGTHASVVGSLLAKAPVESDQVASASAYCSSERLQVPSQNMTMEDLKETRIVDQSTPSSTESPHRISDGHVREAERYMHITSSHTPVCPQSSDIEARIQKARIINQSAPSSRESREQPETSETEESFYSDAEGSKEAPIVQSSSASPQQATPRHSLRPISGVSETSPQRASSTSPAPWPLPGVEVESSLPQSLEKKHTSPGFHTPRLVSDYRITASNPKALTGGPIAWPVTKLSARRRRSDVIVTVGGVAKGGESETAGRMVQAFLLDENEWRELERMPSARNHHVVHCLNGFLYVVGGSDPHTEGNDFLKPVSSVYEYELRAGKWSEAHPMNAARIFHEVTALFGQLYVVGGQDQDGRTLATVECYSPTTDRWHYVAPLPSARYGVALTVHCGRLWVAGGFAEEDLARSSTVPTDVLCYNPFRDEWNAVAHLRFPRCHASLLEMANTLYVIGGFVGDSSASDLKSQSMSSIEAYDDSSESWEFVADLWQGRHDANTVTVGDKAYIIGGMEDENEDPLPNVECFDPLTVSWTPGLAALPSARFGHACCVVPSDTPIKLPPKS